MIIESKRRVQEKIERDSFTVRIYISAAMKENVGEGSFVAIVEAKDLKRELVGRSRMTTKNQLELMAAVASLKTLNRSCSIQLHTSSAYLFNGATRWIELWKLRNWRTKGEGPIRNVDFWRALDELIGRHRITWTRLPSRSPLLRQARRRAAQEFRKLRNGSLI